VEKWTTITVPARILKKIKTFRTSKWEPLWSVIDRLMEESTTRISEDVENPGCDPSGPAPGDRTSLGVGTWRENRKQEKRV